MSIAGNSWSPAACAISSRKRGERIPPLVLCKRTCVSLRTLDHHLKGLLALDAGDDADRAGGRLQQRSLLDMQFEIALDGKAERPVRQIGKRLMEAIERFA